VSTITLTLLNLDIEENNNILRSKDNVSILVHMALSDVSYIPPFLPAFVMRIDEGSLSMLRQRLDEIMELYKRCGIYEDDLRLGRNPLQGIDYNEKGKAQILRCIQQIGLLLNSLGNPPNSFGVITNMINKLVQKRKFDNLIIYTNDVSVPWQWMRSPINKKFICEEIAMGTIFSAEPDEIKSSWDDYSIKDLSLQNRITEVPEVLLLGGNLEIIEDPGDKRSTRGNEIVNNHLKALKNLFVNPDSFCGSPGNLFLGTDRFDENSIKIISKFYDSDDSSQKEGNRNIADEVVQYLVPPITNSLKLFHYIGHFVDQRLILDYNRYLTMEQMRQVDFKSEPLIFLHCCGCGTLNASSSKTGDDKNNDPWHPASNFSTFLLNKRACGVVVTLLPVHHTSRDFAKRFYQLILQEHHTIGTALRLAREGMGSDDPERLFFQLYGDPRKYLFSESDIEE
jgi:hypothetical protein